jgi:TonB family protein
MQRFTQIAFPVLVAFFMLESSASAQLSRGMLPEYFHLPSANDVVHFTSPQRPDFPVPQYPESHRQKQVEGAVEVTLFVSAEGDVVRADVSVSSGDELFDDAALRGAMKAHFPAGYATVHGRAVNFTIDVPFYFLLSPDPEMYWQSRLELARIESEYEVRMKEFQDYLSERTKTSKTRIEGSQKRVEDCVASAKRLHRVLAEKKETAILRLREEIAMTKERIEDPAAAQNSSMAWRTVSPARAVATVVMPANVSGVITQRSLSNNDLDRLQDELELKKSYL